VLAQQRDLLADDHAHRAAEELEVHHAERAGEALDLGGAGHHRVRLAGLLLGLHQLLGVRHAVVEAEQVLGAQVLPHLVEAARVDRDGDALARRQGEVVAAGAADPVLLLEVLAEEHRPAGLALDPESTGHVLLLAEAGPSHVVRFLFGLRAGGER
jgi:hypothetical protein